METTVTYKAFSEDGTWEQKALRMRDLCSEMELGIAKLASYNNKLVGDLTEQRGEIQRLRQLIVLKTEKDNTKGFGHL